MTIRDAARDDLDAIAEINNYYRTNTRYIWDRSRQTAGELEAWYEEHVKPPYCAIVAEDEGRITGYASLSRFRPHSGYAATAEDSIYVAPGHTGGGCGSLLMAALLERAARNGLRVVTAWIDSGNVRSVRFHEKFGFRVAGRMDDVGMIDGEKASVIILQRAIAPEDPSEIRRPDR